MENRDSIAMARSWTHADSMAAAQAVVHGALDAHRTRAALAEVEVDASQSTEKVLKEIRAAVGLAKRLQIWLVGGRWPDAVALAEILRQSYEAVGEEMAARGLAAADVDVLPKLDAHTPNLAGRSLDSVVLGGTFDRLHAGHKVLLTIAAALATKELFVGVSGPPLLANKQGASVLEPWASRAASVSTFVKRIRPNLPILLVELFDPFGPALKPEAQVLVVSEETASGGAMVNQKRKELGLSELKIVVSPLVRAAPGAGDKVSSTTLREQFGGLKALQDCWRAVAGTLLLPEEQTESWAATLSDLAIAAEAQRPREPPRRSFLERLRVDLETVTSSLKEEMRSASSAVRHIDPHILGEGLAACVVAAWPAAVGSASSRALEQAALLNIIAHDIRLPQLHHAAGSLRLDLEAWPRVLGFVQLGPGPQAGSDFVELAMQAFQSWGAFCIRHKKEQGLAAQIHEALRAGARVVVVRLSANLENSQCCDEVWGVGAAEDRDSSVGLDAVLQIASGQSVESALVAICQARFPGLLGVSPSKL